MSEQKTRGANEAIDFSDGLRNRHEKLTAPRQQGVTFPNGLRRDHTSGQPHRELDAKDNQELESLDIKVSITGRMMTRHIIGKVSFVTLQDVGSHIQLYAIRDSLSGGVYNDQLRRRDLGGTIGVRDTLFKTQTGEPSTHHIELRLLIKALCPLPDKFYGLQDQEVRYRQRCLGSITNNKSCQTFVVRSRVLAAIRQFMVARGFMEAEIPMVQVIPGGAFVRPFITHHSALDLDMYLRIAPELYLKHLVVGGFERVFEINRNSRNEGIPVCHNPKFAVMELYMVCTDYHDLIELTESPFRALVQEALGTTKITCDEHVFDFGKPFERLTMCEAIKEHRLRTDMADLDNSGAAKALAESVGITVEKSWGLGRTVTGVLDEVAETHLIQSAFITEYPAEVPSLARRNDVNPEITDHPEFFIGGREVGNGLNELNNVEDQAGRSQEQVNAEAAGDGEAMFYDGDYVTALEYGLPPTAGLDTGTDRMIILFTSSHTIRGVTLFPAMHPQK